MYSKEDLSFILFNNRSVNGVVKNFLPININPYKLIELEENLSKIKSMYNSGKFIEVNSRELDLNSEDVYITKKQITYANDYNGRKIKKFNVGKLHSCRNE